MQRSGTVCCCEGFDQIQVSEKKRHASGISEEKTLETEDR
jgi:hypothetical protein